MVVNPLLALAFWKNLLAVVFVICAVVLILIVLIQKGKGGGLSGAFGGSGGASGLLGTKTGDFLTWFTIGLAMLFIVLSVVMAKIYRPEVGEYGEDVVQQTSAAVKQQTSAATEQQTETGQDDMNSPLKKGTNQ